MRVSAERSMIKLVINGWSDERAWLNRDNWSRLDYCQRLYHCTYLRGQALNSAADSLVNRASCELELVNREQAEALIYTLESCGARFELKYLWSNKVILLNHYRKGVKVKKVTKAIADAR
jgi:hypothetical protein